tara:strand:+ start:4471 stop:5241 length:771 start_codon:yes stop_codon:yes gene_type:complete
MATTFKELTNQILRELNEVELTTSSFPSAVGIQAHIKDCINKAYLDIAIDEPQWPFLAAAESGSLDPMYGNASIESVAGTRWYELKPSSSSLGDDYGSIDWDNFYLTTVGVAGETAPYVSKGLHYSTTEDWNRFRRASENADDADQAKGGEPTHIIRSPDGRKVGLSPIPNKAYKVWFSAYNQITKLSSESDTIVIPDSYINVVLAKARYYCWQFKDNPQAASFAMEDYKKSYDQMRSNLLEPTPTYITDDRVRFV